MFLPKSHVRCLFFLKMFSSASSPLVRVRYGSARGEVLRGSSCALIGWFPGLGLTCPVIYASRMFYLVVFEEVGSVLLPVSESRHVQYDSACSFCPRSPSFCLIGWFPSPGPARPFIGAWMIPGICSRKCSYFYDVYPVFPAGSVSYLRGKIIDVVFVLYIILIRVPLCMQGI